MSLHRSTLRLLTLALACTCGALGMFSPEWRAVLEAQTYYYYCEHGTHVAKSCEGPKRSCATDGDCTDTNGCTDDVCDPTKSNVTDCLVTIMHADTCGDTTKIIEAFDTQDLGGDDVRVPAAGDLPIDGVIGNAVCCAGPALPCFVGPVGSTALVPAVQTGCGDLSLPGAPTEGAVSFRQNTYVVQPDDPDPLPDRATIGRIDLCDVQSIDCSTAPAIATASTDTELVTGCVHTPSQPGKACPDTDGDQCTSAGCDGQGNCDQTDQEVTCGNPDCEACDPASGICSPLPEAPDECRTAPHFQCFEIHRPPLDLVGVSLDDQFGASTVDVLQAKRLCTPADKNDEDPTVDLNGEHLTEYMIKQSAPRFERVRGHVVTDQFGTLRVDVVRPDRMLVPTAKSLTATPGAGPFGLDHFKCYRLKHARFRAKDLAVDTQFGRILVDIKRPFRLCVPADKNGEGIRKPEQQLMCYQTRPAAGRPVFRGPDVVFTNNQFGPDDFAIFGARELCVPTLTPPAATTP